MKFELEEKAVRFFPEGRIDADSSAVFEKEITSALEKNPDHLPLFDMAGLEYISSAGLRVLLKIAHRYSKKLRIVNVPEEIFEVLMTTGFTEVFNVYKVNDTSLSKDKADKYSVREVDVSEYKHIYGDNVMDTYLTGEDTSVMLYHENVSLELIRKNKSKSEISLKAGVPVLISYDIVSCGERFGIVFENIKNSESLIIKMQNDKAHLADYAAKLALWTKKIHSIDADHTKLESADKMILMLYNRLKSTAILKPVEYDSLTKVIKNAPDSTSYCHNDLTPHNILANGDEYIAIDAYMAAKGHAIHDLASFAWYFKFLPQLGIDSQAVMFTDSEKELIWSTFLKTYFGTDDENFLYKAEYQINQFTAVKYLAAAALIPNFASKSVILKLKRMAIAMSHEIEPLCF